MQTLTTLPCARCQIVQLQGHIHHAKPNTPGQVHHKNVRPGTNCESRLFHFEQNWEATRHAACSWPNNGAVMVIPAGQYRGEKLLLTDFPTFRTYMIPRRLYREAEKQPSQRSSEVPLRPAVVTNGRRLLRPILFPRVDQLRCRIRRGKNYPCCD